MPFSHEFREACTLALTEMWLSDTNLDKELIVNIFGKPFSWMKMWYPWGNLQASLSMILTATLNPLSTNFLNIPTKVYINLRESEINAINSETQF